MTTEYLPANAARVQGKIDTLDVSEQAIANVDQALTWVGLKTYTQLCDQLAELAEVAIRDNGRLEQQVVELRRELSESKAALLHVPFPLPIDEWARGPKLDNKKEKKNEQND